MVARAEAAAHTRRRVLVAALDLYAERDFDEVSLDRIAARARTTVQTVLRHFATKDELLNAAAEGANREIEGRRAEVPAGDIARAARCLVADYELYGDAIMRLLAHEDRAPAFARVAETGRRLHHEWVKRTFAPQLRRRRGAARRRMLAQLIAATDVCTWKLLRKDVGLGRAGTERAVAELIEGVVAVHDRRGSGGG